MQDPIDVPEQLHEAMQAAALRLLFLNHPSGAQYVMLPMDDYVAMCLENVPDRFTIEEQQWLLIQAGLRAGWDNPEMDIYNDIEPQK